MSTYQVPAAALPGDLQSALQVRPVQASAYTANPFDLVPCDTTSGAWTGTLPLMPASGTTVGFKLIAQTGTNAVTITTSGTDVINKTGGSTTVTLSMLGQGVMLQYEAGIWTITGDDLPLGQLDSRYAGTHTVMPVFNIVNYGAACNGSTDDTAAWNSAISAAQTAGGGMVFHPGGVSVVSVTSGTAISATGDSQVEIVGIGGTSGSGTSGSAIHSASTSGSIINAQNTANFRMSGIKIQTTGAFTGIQLDLRNVSGSDTAFARVDNCSFYGNSTNYNTATGIHLGKANGCTIEKCNLNYLEYGVYGIDATYTYSNGNTIRDCQFAVNGTTHIMNPGTAWTIEDNLIEALYSTGAASGIIATFAADGVAIRGNWFGDVTATSSAGRQIQVLGLGWCIDNNYIGGNTSAYGVYVSSGADSFSIRGNYFVATTNGVYLAGSPVNYEIGPNAFSAATPTPGPVTVRQLEAPPDRGLLAWTFSPQGTALGESLGSAMGNGHLFLTKIWLRQPQTITNVVVPYGNTMAASGTASENYIALFDSTGTQRAITADMTTIWSTSGNANTTMTHAFTSAYAAAAGFYWIGFLFNMTTGPSMVIQTTGNTSAVNFGLTAATCFAGFSGAAQTTMPSSFTPSAMSVGHGASFPFLCGLS